MNNFVAEYRAALQSKQSPPQQFYDFSFNILCFFLNLNNLGYFYFNFSFNFILYINLNLIFSIIFKPIMKIIICRKSIGNRFSDPPEWISGSIENNADKLTDFQWVFHLPIRRDPSEITFTYQSDFHLNVFVRNLSKICQV